MRNPYDQQQWKIVFFGQSVNNKITTKVHKELNVKSVS